MANRQQIRAMKRAKDEEVAVRAKAAAAMRTPAMRLARLEAAVFGALVPDFQTLIKELQRKKILEVKTESGLILPGE